MDQQLRVPPHSIEAEQNVLGAMMLDESKIGPVCERLTKDDFYTARHRAIFYAITEMSGRGDACDAVTLEEWLSDHGFSDHIPPGYLIELANYTLSSRNAVTYANIVRDRALRRKLIDVGTTMAGDGYSGEESANDLIASAIADLMALQKVEAQCEFTLRQAMTQAYAAADEARRNGGKIPGIPTGLERLDQVLGGWHKGDLIVIGARPAMGKTALMLNMMLAADKRCGIISAEQPALQIGSRVMSMDSRVAAEKMRNGRFEEDDVMRLQQSVERLVERKCMIYDRSSPTIADVTRMARKWVAQEAMEVLFCDYVQRIEAAKASAQERKSERVGESVRGLKNIARDCGIPVVTLAQVGRHVEQRADKQPAMGDLSDSSEIEKEADVVITLYRPHVYDEDANPHEAILSVEKNRHGRTGVVRCVWMPETMRFENEATYD